jgi:hypothetical protein
VILATFQSKSETRYPARLSGRQLRLTYRIHQQPNAEQHPETDPETNGSPKHVPYGGIVWIQHED